jgi:hypothetical protein
LHGSQIKNWGIPVEIKNDPHPLPVEAGKARFSRSGDAAQQEKK